MQDKTPSRTPRDEASRLRSEPPPSFDQTTRDARGGSVCLALAPAARARATHDRVRDSRSPVAREPTTPTTARAPALASRRRAPLADRAPISHAAGRARSADPTARSLARRAHVWVVVCVCAIVASQGDHVLVGSYDRRLAWFDMDLGSAPYKTLKYHTKALRDVAFHRRHPLVASCADDGTVHVFHATVYDDLLRSPLVVPVKVLRGHETRDGVGVLAIAFAPSQPWIFSAGADGDVLLFHEL